MCLHESHPIYMKIRHVWTNFVRLVQKVVEMYAAALVGETDVGGNFMNAIGDSLRAQILFKEQLLNPCSALYFPSKLMRN